MCSVESLLFSLKLIYIFEFITKKKVIKLIKEMAMFASY